MVLKKSEYLKIATILLVFVVGVYVSIKIQEPEFSLPILSPSDLNPALVEDSIQSVGMDHFVGEFPC